MLRELAIADAYGAGFEFASREVIKSANTLKSFIPHPLYNFTAKYTDDTQMSLALAELLTSQHSGITKLDIADSFVKCFKRDPRLGYSKGFYSLLTEVSNGSDLLAQITPLSERNGAAMRAAPLGTISNESELIKLAKIQAEVTHNTRIGIASSCAVALAAHYFIYKKGPLEKICNYLNHLGFGDWDFNWNGSVSVNAYDTVSAALSCLVKHRSLSDLLVSTVDCGGDTDSVASIAIAIASCSCEYKKDLPDELFNMLDEPIFGIDYLDAVDKELLKSR